MNYNKLAQRIAIYVIGVLLLALGVVLNTKCFLGVSTTNSVPFVISKISAMSLGTACTVVYLADVLFQCIIYRKIKIKVILQFPFSFVFGWIVDFYNKFIIITNPNMTMKITLLVLAILCIAVGISMVVNMDFIPNPPDGGVQALSAITNLPFGRAKWHYACYYCCYQYDDHRQNHRYRNWNCSSFLYNRKYHSLHKQTLWSMVSLCI
jgi:uncharacterized membrane protein YczE